MQESMPVFFPEQAPTRPPLTEVKENRTEKKVVGPYSTIIDEDGNMRLLEKHPDKDEKHEVLLDAADIGPEDRADFFETLAAHAEVLLPNHLRVRSPYRGEVLLVEGEEADREGSLGLIRGGLNRRGGLNIDFIRSEIPGGGFVLMAELLKQYPTAEYIYGELDGVNEAVYRDARRADGLSRIEALRMTPAYKTRAKCGFGLLEPQPEGSELGHRGRPILVTRPFKK